MPQPVPFNNHETETEQDHESPLKKEAPRRSTRNQVEEFSITKLPKPNVNISADKSVGFKRTFGETQMIADELNIDDDLDKNDKYVKYINLMYKQPPSKIDRFRKAKAALR